MKKTIIFTVLLISTLIVNGQKSVDTLFKMYSGKDGFTTVSVSGDLLKFLSSLDDSDDESPLPSVISQIRILSQEDKSMDFENFYDKVMLDINLDDYEEFMRVKESHQDMRMLVRAEGNHLREFLLIGGGKDNIVIQIKGDMTFKEARKFSESVKKDHGMNISADIDL